MNTKFVQKVDLKEGELIMAKIKGWHKEREVYGNISWRNENNPDLTVEIVSWDSQGVDTETDEGFSGWGYGYPAIKGKGIPSTPDFFESKTEAKEWAVKWMRSHPKG